jgi:hypothetical protein
VEARWIPLIAGPMQEGPVGPGRSATFEASPTKGMLVAPARLGDSVHVLSRRAGAIAPALRAIAPVLLDKDATDWIRVSENNPSRQLGE